MLFAPFLCLASSAWGQQKFVTENEDGVEIIVSEVFIENEVTTEVPTDIVTASPTSTQVAEEALPTDVYMVWPEALPEETTMSAVRAALCSATVWPAEDEGYFVSCDFEEEDQEGGGRILYGMTTTIETETIVTSTETETTLTTIRTLEPTEPASTDDDGLEGGDEDEQQEEEEGGDENEQQEEEDTLDDITDSGDSDSQSSTDTESSAEDRILTVTSTAVEGTSGQNKVGDGQELEDDDSGGPSASHPYLHFYPVAFVFSLRFAW